MKKYLKSLALLAAITIIFGTIYAASQSVLRSSANDPQIQMAEDAAAVLNNGVDPASLLTSKVDASKSLAPFIVIYNKQGRAVASSVYNGQAPLREIPIGVLKSAGSGYNAVTWQPEYNIRLAAVAVEANQYYVVSARSLTEVENRETTLTKTVLLGWLLTVAVISFLYKNKLSALKDRKQL
ncbi:MAG: hypothetical protein JWO47_881 [Candidatus Saccharibacteria bacterium]|nr:hypothetical protein [Candidatus Saccharibacteria bacterium]